MKSYLNTLNEREKWMVISATLCVFIYVYYLFLYAPLNNKVEQRRTQLVEKIQTLDWMKKVKQQTHTYQKKQTIDNSQLLTLLANQLKDNSTLKFPYQLQQTGSGDIQLTFDQVPFNLFMTWLININNKYTIMIKQFDASNVDTAGIAKLMIIISAAS